MEQKQSRTSLFATLPGLILLLICTVIAIYFRATILSAFLLLLFLICLAACLWSRIVLRHVDVAAQTISGQCQVGSVLRLKITIRNHSFLPLVWLDTIFPAGVSPILCSENADCNTLFLFPGTERPQKTIRRRVTWLLWHQEISWEEPLYACRRAVLSLEGFWLQAGDGFGLSAQRKYNRISLPLTLVVYPHIEPVSVQPFLQISQQTISGRNGQMEDVTLLRNSRPYAPGDPVKKINWRLLAHGLPMEINLYERLSPGCTAFILCPDTFRTILCHTETIGSEWQEYILLEQKFEGMISLIASVVLALQEQGMPSALLLPGYADRDAVFCTSLEENGPSGILEALAAIEYLAQDTFFPYEEFWQIVPQFGTIFLCSLSDRDVALADLEQDLGRNQVRHLVWEHSTGAGQKGNDKDSAETSCLYAEDILREKPDLTMYREQAHGNPPISLNLDVEDNASQNAKGSAK